MKNKDSLRENPFMLLQVSPADPDAVILSKALDLKLLTGMDTQEAEDELLQPGSRLGAEISYLPGLPETEAEKVRLFLQNAGETGNTAHRTDREMPYPVPDLISGPGLAEANLASAFLDYWPAADVESAAAMCRSIIMALQGVTAAGAFEAICADRMAAGRPLPDEDAVKSRLAGHRRELLARAAKRCEELPADQYLRLQEKLADAYCAPEDELGRSPLLDELVCVHLYQKELPAVSRITEEIQEKISRYHELHQSESAREIPPALKLSKNKKDKPSNSAEENKKKTQIIADICELLDAWDRLTISGRRISKAKGLSAKYSDEMFLSVHGFLVCLYNDYHDGWNGITLIRKIDEVFTDISPQYLELLQKNVKTLLKK